LGTNAIRINKALENAIRMKLKIVLEKKKNKQNILIIREKIELNFLGKANRARCLRQQTAGALQESGVYDWG